MSGLIVGTKLRMMLVVFAVLMAGMLQAQLFTKHTIDGNLSWASGVATADIDGDLDIDVVATGASVNEVDWYENDGSQNFTKHVVDNTVVTARSCYGVDMDLDTDIDIIATADGSDMILWFQNDGGQNFTPDTVATNLASAWDVSVVDLDQDNDFDVVATAASANVVRWYENDGAQNFTGHDIDAFLDGAEGLYVIDLDQDNDLDVVAAGIFGDVVTWYENDSNQVFTEHSVDPSFNGANDVAVGDMDVDGDYDIVASGSQAHLVKWYENDGSQNFTMHTVASLQGARAVFVANLNDDSLPDIAAVSILDAVMWYESMGGGIFTPHTIDLALDLAFGLYVDDLDGDTDPDVLATGATANDLVWYESDLVGVAEHPVEGPGPAVIRFYCSPNPSREFTVIHYALARPATAVLRIYNVSGQLVSIMKDESSTIGEKEIVWDRRNTEGVRLPSGIYIYTLDTGESLFSGRLSVID